MSTGNPSWSGTERPRADVAAKAQRTVLAWLFVVAASFVRPADAPAQTRYGRGSGTPEDPYIIRTAEDLIGLGQNRDDWDKCFRLEADLDLSGVPPETVGGIGEKKDPFEGTFDGNGRTIRNLTCARPTGIDVGLFAHVWGMDAEIHDLHLVDPNIQAPDSENVGALVGHLYGGAVANCTATRATVRGGSAVGGLVGCCEGPITACSATGAVEGRHSVGGLVGLHSWEGIMRFCWAEASLSGSGSVGGLAGAGVMSDIRRSAAGGRVNGFHDVGGLIGSGEGVIVTDSYAIADVIGVYAVGGLIGHHAASCDCCAGHRVGEVHMSYAAGPVSAETRCGGLIGMYDAECIVNSCFWDVEATGLTHSDGGTGLTTAELQSRQRLRDAFWWFMPNAPGAFWVVRGDQDYPRHGWQCLLGDDDDDADLDWRDFAALAAHWGRSDVSFWRGGMDLTEDGFVDAGDLVLLADRWLARKHRFGALRDR